jgi:hypothetical protein
VHELIFDCRGQSIAESIKSCNGSLRPSSRWWTANASRPTDFAGAGITNGAHRRDARNCRFSAESGCLSRRDLTDVLWNLFDASRTRSRRSNSFPEFGTVGRWCDDPSSVAGADVAFHQLHRYAATSRAVNKMPLELILRAVDVPEPLQRIRAQSETEARPVRHMHHAVRTDVE